MKNFKFTLMFFILSVFSFSNTSMAQGDETDTFNLVKQESGHYTFSAKINDGIEATFFLESAIHILLIDSLFAFNNQESLNLEFIKNAHNQKMNLGGKKYNITHKAKGIVNISNNTSYQGEIFLLSNYKSTHEIAIPIQKLYTNSNHERSIVKVDLANGILQIISHEQLTAEKHKYVKEKMNFDNYLNMPAIKTDLKIIDKGKTRTLNGNFNLDLGNGSLLYLCKQNKSVQEFLKANADIKLRYGFNKKREIIAKVIVPKKCILCNLKFKNGIIGITNALPLFTTEGLIGIKFFEKTIAIFDFSKSDFYIKKK